MANVIIDLAAEFTGKKAFKQAETSTEKLTKGVKRLAAAFGVAFGVRGAALAVKAFAEDDKAAQALGKTLQNLGLAYGSSAATVNGYISRLEQQTGVLDDELRPAMDRFLRATLSVTKSQELLNLALDISAGTGKSLTQVSQSLQKAYLGQTQALGRLGVGLSKAELTSASFEEIQARLSVLFAGQASTAANTYAGEIAKLQVAVNNAKETIGKGFVDALKTASGSSTIDPVVAGIGKIANAFAYLTRETGKFIAITKEAFTGFDLFAPKGGYGNTNKGMGNVSMSVGSQDTQRADAAAKNKAAAAAKAQAAALAKTQSSILKAQKDQLKIAKARAIFDLQKIQIEAALKGKISEEDKIRLKLMQAIEDENLTQIKKYQDLLTAAQLKTKDLTDLLATVKTLEIKNPFGSWSIDPLTASINALTTSIGGVGTQIQASGREWSSFANNVANTVIRPNLSEWSSSYSGAAAAAAAATASANASLTATTAAAAKAAADAAAASAAAIAAANKSSADAIAKANEEAKSALEKLNQETAASTAAATKAAQDAIDAANKTAQETVASILAASAAAAAAAASSATGTSGSVLQLLKDAESASAASSSTTGNTTININVETGVGDPNAIAEAIENVLAEANARGTITNAILGIA